MRGKTFEQLLLEFRRLTTRKVEFNLVWDTVKAEISDNPIFQVIGKRPGYLISVMIPVFDLDDGIFFAYRNRKGSVTDFFEYDKMTKKEIIDQLVWGQGNILDSNGYCEALEEAIVNLRKE